MPKRSIRSKFLAERKAHPVRACVDLSDEIQRRFLQSHLFRDARCLALYSAVQNEVNTDEVARQTLAAGKTLVFPRVNGDNLEFVSIDKLEALVPGAFGVLEPESCNLVSIDALDLVIVPGVAFDRRGHRLGYGRGYYDRALAVSRSDCLRIGFAYNFQLVDELPFAEHDESLSVLVTESHMLNFSA